jgi:hypothetical protein
MEHESNEQPFGEILQTPPRRLALYPLLSYPYLPHFQRIWKEVQSQKIWILI